MDDISIFEDKAIIPTDEDLVDNLGTTLKYWVQIRNNVKGKYPDAKEEWNFPGKKYGWSFRIKDKKRAIIYLLPRDKFFKVAFVFGQKATDQILKSKISREIKNELKSVKKYAEGRGIRIDIKNDKKISDIIKLIEIKLDN